MACCSVCSADSLPNMARPIQRGDCVSEKQQNGLLSFLGQTSKQHVDRATILLFRYALLNSGLILLLDRLMQARLLVLQGKYRSHDYQQLNNSFDVVYVQLHLKLWL